MGYAARALEVAPISRLFVALGDDVRLRIVALLPHGELCVCHIEEALGLLQSNVSRHMAILRAAGVVDTRRDFRWVYYSLARQADPARKRLLDGLVRSFSQKDVLRRDVERLRRSKGPGACK